MTPLQAHLAALEFDPEQIRDRRAAVRARVLQSSKTITAPQFTALSTADLTLLFQAYDRLFFKQTISKALVGAEGGPLTLRVSRRLTRTAGLTTHSKRARGPHRHTFEICISSTLMFQTFTEGAAGRAIEVCGVPCVDRLDALQRVFEHELLHLVELLATGQTQCSQPPFLALARVIFGHKTNRHTLVTPVESAQVRQGIQIGALVSFMSEGAPMIGTVVRITRRATVLVPHEGGDHLLEGIRCQKYYVPLEALTLIPQDDLGPRRRPDRPEPVGGA